MKDEKKLKNSTKQNEAKNEPSDIQKPETGKINIAKNIFIGLGGHSLKNHFEVLKSIGKGGSGKVYRVRNKVTKKNYACKKISKLNINDYNQFKNEMEILMKLDHPNIIKLYDVYESHNSLYLVMEECEGGELFDRISDRIESNDMYTEKDACEIIKQIVGAIKYCHNNNIVHRDLKPENLLYLKPKEDNDNTLKIIDFGLSQDLNIEKNLDSKVGTPYYVPPEVLEGKYSQKCDIWSAGVILYILLFGEPPFKGSSDNDLYEKIKKIDYSFPESKRMNVSKEAIDLIKKMLVKESERYSASEVLAHPWFNLLKDDSISLEKLNFNGTNFFKEYMDGKRLKKIILLYIASKLQEKEILDLKRFFMAFDTDNNGQIDYKEFEQVLLNSNSKEIKKKDIKQLFSEIDCDNNDKIDYTEFIAATLKKNIYLKKEKLYEAFSAYDLNGDGKITKEELMCILKLQPNQNKFVDKLIDEADKNGDGMLDYKEFVDLMYFQ